MADAITASSNEPGHVAENTDVPTTSARTTIHSLSPELFTKILSEIAALDVLVCADEKVLNDQRILPLRRVCRTFRSTIDYILMNKPPQHIWLWGSIPFEDSAAMAEIYSQARSLIKSRISRLIRTPRHFDITVHLYPDPGTVGGAFEWDCVSQEVARGRTKRDYIAQRAMTGHHAAALMLSRVLHDLILGQPFNAPRFAFTLIFHEVDGTYFDPADPSQDLKAKPESLPFWDLEALRHIVREWQWIRRCDQTRGKALGSFVFLPNVAFATCATMSARRVYKQCAQVLNEAWTSRESVDGPPTRRPYSRYIYVSVPGFSSKVAIFRDRVFAEWLTKLGRYSLNSTCFAARGISAPGADDDDDDDDGNDGGNTGGFGFDQNQVEDGKKKAVLLDRPELLSFDVYGMLR